MDPLAKLTVLDTRTGLHLSFIQEAINRYALQATAIKVVTVALLAVIFFASTLARPTFQYIWITVATCLVMFALWGVDGYFQAQQRRYVALYDDVRSGRCEAFSMDVTAHRTAHRTAQTLWSTPVCWLYLASISCIALLSLQRVG